MATSKRRSSFSAKSDKKIPAPPAKPRNADVRTREYLTSFEIKRLKEAARNNGRYGFRDWMLITVMYAHALRAGEAVDLRWDQIDFARARLHVNRLKNGDPSVHPLEGEELRNLRKLKREYPESEFVFCSERQGPLSTRTAHHIVARAGELAGMTFPVHPHMLRHAKGYQLASKAADTRSIQAYLGHRNIQHTVLYTKLDSRLSSTIQRAPMAPVR
jgi:type 1 fimbriae regulatory protein FimB/type 1 fimbriae regulatory protein FimE